MHAGAKHATSLGSRLPPGHIDITHMLKADSLDTINLDLLPPDWKGQQACEPFNVAPPMKE